MIPSVDSAAAYHWKVNKMQVDKKIHILRSWKVNEITGDFVLWDVWEVPISADNSNTENFQAFYRVAVETFKKMQKNNSPAGLLFTIRHWISRVFPLDQNINTLPIPGCEERSVGTRLMEIDRHKSKKGIPIEFHTGGLAFLPVYLFDDESLHEISNDTVHALIHVGWIKKGDDTFTATLAIYVKTRGLCGMVYIKLIGPFRHYIVYPAMMKTIKKEWEKYLLWIKKNKSTKP